MESSQQGRNKKFMLAVVALVILGVAVFGVTYAFFNYTRTGESNTVKTGRIYFATDHNTINLTNAFPITSTQARSDTNNSRTLNIIITGDTDYANGLEYLVTATDVHMSVGEGLNERQIPLAIEVGVDSITTSGVNDEPDVVTNLGVLDDDYFVNRVNYATNHTNKYKVLYDGSLDEGDRLLVGYIAPNANPGVRQGVYGKINIKAYFDTNSIAITDTYDPTSIDENEEHLPTDNNGTTEDWVRGREVFTTSEWNSIQNSGKQLSFKIKVETNEGIWVF